MPELHTKAHDYNLTALLRLSREFLSLPILGGNFLQEDDSFLLLEIGDNLELQASTGLTLTYKLVAESHDYALTALTKFPPSPVFVTAEGNIVLDPALDAEVNVVADFDAVTDADGDLNDHADAAHDGATGLKYTVDDTNLMHGQINFSAVDQTSFVMSLRFNTNDVNFDAGDWIILFMTRDGVAEITLSSILYNPAGTSTGFKLNCRVLADVGGTISSSYGAELSAGWHYLLYMGERSSGIGANDGWLKLWVDGEYYIGVTGINNDTQDWDNTMVGLTHVGVLTSPSGSFYIDTIKTGTLDTVGDLLLETGDNLIYTDIRGN